MRSVSESEFNWFTENYSKLEASVSKNKEKLVSSLYSKIEKNLIYLGCTAIEDKLQEGVPDTIASFFRAGIRFWMLTGDKLETAIEIAKSCRIIENTTQVLRLTLSSIN